MSITLSKSGAPKATKSYAARAAREPLAPFTFDRRDPLPHDIVIDVLFCGVCHSDIHQARDEWGGSLFPMVPGHEIAGRVIGVGDKVTKFKVGDLAAVGCFVDSCRTCGSCGEGLEQYCENGMTVTYNGIDRSGAPTFGGYSERLVVDEAYSLRVSEKLDLAATAPLLCAGITLYSPLRHWKAGPGKKVGIVGLGGLGHMGVKFAHAFGAHVVLFTTSPGKVEDGKRLGADEVVISKDADAMAKHANSFDLIVDAVSAEHDMNAYLNLIKRDGTLVLVGVPEKPLSIHPFSVVAKRKNFAGSCIGGIAETQEMLDFCAEKGIVSDIELIPIDKINEAYERMLKSDVKYRFVIDMASLKNS
ncbi:uncharacterized zinc-type alcohol dehydrogenase-like protein [Verrucomicrobium sp. GAS474]|uniref:NAD(P)-dependent alcohol dehydrogenase n=1 Tax=Verrucomicrobium sp. GAS474 TaxID=1882831 RepID=UPI00087AF40F|nr:NAD(P)-dependent alcohol dehydrogenase [Verrucomicrobium sp. GAS474]SDT87335.1 uncharacterized zinc-type alcohol dehydrogenase-like protein [Verrucomicrobium sp. GAS474]